MAARKSCTKLTWDEAKSKSGINTTKGNVKNKGQLRKQSHNDVLAAKIIAKQGGGKDDRKLKKAERRFDEKSKARERELAEEREARRLASLQEVEPYKMADEKLNALVKASEQLSLRDDLNISYKVVSGDLDEMMKVADSKRMHVDEFMALEAMLEANFWVSSDSYMVELQQKLDRYEGGEDDSAFVRSIAEHPPVSCLLKIEIPDIQPKGYAMSSDTDLVALALLRVTMPPEYPVESPPDWKIEYFMVVDKLARCSADKPLESLAYYDEFSLQDAMRKYAKDELLPYPCVYELAVTWLTENLSEFLQMHPLA